ncbi:MAG: hypothetical protein ACREJB_04690 [Planctomycetaceae bacterium]
MSEPNRRRISDGELEELLVEFFQKELPAPLRALPPGSATEPATSLAPQPSRRPRRGRRFGIIAAVLGTAAACLLAIVLWPDAPLQDRPIADRAGQDAVPPNDAVARPEPDDANAGPAIRIAERDLPGATEVVNTEGGPVAFHSAVHVSHVDIIDPATGTRVQYDVHELNIEILPAAGEAVGANDREPIAFGLALNGDR